MNPPSEDNFLSGLAQEFLLDYSIQLANLKTSITDKDRKVVSEFAHRVKGTAGIFGFEEISRTLEQIERRLGVENWQEIEALYGHLVKLIEKEITHRRPLPQTILIAEDEKHLQRLLEYKLKNSGFQVLVTANGEEALKVAKQRRPDLIVLDVMMPIMDGSECLAALKRDLDLKSIPVVMLTAMNLESQVVRGLELGAEDYITKPFSPPEFVARIKAVLKRFQKLNHRAP
ncbi:MAG: response regulator [Bacteroidota bacterium]